MNRIDQIKSRLSLIRERYTSENAKDGQYRLDLARLYYWLPHYHLASPCSVKKIRGTWYYSSFFTVPDHKGITRSFCGVMLPHSVTEEYLKGPN